MPSRGGLAAFVTEANRLSQRFSVAAESIGGMAEEVVAAELEKGVSRMRQIILSGGINKTKKGGPRVKSGKMLGSVEGKISGSSNTRVQAKFGFSDDAPAWTLWQEKGTYGGERISQMLAFTTANKELADSLVDTFGKGDWFNIRL